MALIRAVHGDGRLQVDAQEFADAEMGARLASRPDEWWEGYDDYKQVFLAGLQRGEIDWAALDAVANDGGGDGGAAAAGKEMAEPSPEPRAAPTQAPTPATAAAPVVDTVCIGDLHVRAPSYPEAMFHSSQSRPCHGLNASAY